MPGPFLNAPPHRHPSLRNNRLRRSLEADFKEHQIDVFVLTHEEFLNLWIAAQAYRGKSQDAIKQRLSEITAMSSAQFSLAHATTYGSAIKDTPSFIALANDFKRSGNILGKFELSTRNGRQYISFKGNHKVRNILQGTRYLANNTKVVNVGIGKEALKQSAKSGFYISIFFSITLNSINWIFEEKYRWTNWVATTSTDVVKALIGALAGILNGSFISTVGAVAVVAIGTGIVVGVTISLGLNAIDNRLKISESIIKYLEHKEANLLDTLSKELHEVIVIVEKKVIRTFKIKVKNELKALLFRKMGDAF
jgi:hypothetical protein